MQILIVEATGSIIPQGRRRPSHLRTQQYVLVKYSNVQRKAGNESLATIDEMERKKHYKNRKTPTTHVIN